MPAYSNTFPPSSIDAGDSANVWATADGTFASLTKTQRVALVQNPVGQLIKVAGRVAFSGAPGVISLQPQVSDFDNDADYQSEGAAITAVGNNNELRFELSVAAKFIRLLATTVTNAVTANVDFNG